MTLIRIMDDGAGMTPEILQTALQFGGSSRFNSRESLGRYGMGLPCSSLSLATRVDVWTSRAKDAIWWSYLDVTEISEKGLKAIPRPQRVANQTCDAQKLSASGNGGVFGRAILDVYELLEGLAEAAPASNADSGPRASGLSSATRIDVQVPKRR